MKKPERYLEIVNHYEACLARHGDTFAGVDYTKPENPPKIYSVMLEIASSLSPSLRQKFSLLDFGCGASHLYEHMLKHGQTDLFEYSGLDTSPRFIELCRRKFPDVRYFLLDVLKDDSDLPEFDYIVMTGVLTEKLQLSHKEMSEYFQALVAKLYSKARLGIAFNVMSKQVDWERDDLFHLSFDDLAQFLSSKVSKNFIIRHDYGLYEYTAYVYRNAAQSSSRSRVAI